MFEETIEIEDRKVGPGQPCMIIAEAGVNHFGDLQKALDLVDLAASAGADVYKTQAFHTETLVSDHLPEWRKRLKEKEVDYKFLRTVKDYCAKRQMIFMCTAHDEIALDWLRDLDVSAFKIGSGERGNIEFLKQHSQFDKPIILSTGMHSETDVLRAIEVFAEQSVNQLAILHCVTSYPVPNSELNLQTITRLRNVFNGPVGYSDHSNSFDSAIAAVALGATIVEKHITLDFDVPNAQDWKVSAGPDDFHKYVSKIRDIEQSLGLPKVIIQKCEEKAEEWALKVVVAKYALNAGQRLDLSHLRYQRAGIGIAPDRVNDIVGKVINTDIEKGRPIQWHQLK